jgi:preprotein translocase subunit SecY
MIIIVFRIGAAIPVPFLDPVALAKMVTTNGAAGSITGYFDILTGGAFSKATIFAMSVTPYINASIIIQLLAIAIPSLARLQKEGEYGRRKIADITRYTTVGLGLVQGLVLYFTLRNNDVIMSKYLTGFVGIWAAIVMVTIFSAGAALMMWLGEQINEKGIGNGISVLLFAGILSRLPSGVTALYGYFILGGAYYVLVPAIGIIAILVIAAIVYMNNAERRIPVQYAKRIVGRKVYGGQSSFIPIKVTMSGVMPIIFASSIISIPTIIGSYLKQGTFWYNIIHNIFGYSTALYAVIYFILIIGFNFFYVSAQYNPHSMSNDLKKNNGGIPGIRPGKPTSDYIKRVLSRITLIGALFLGVIAIFPILITQISTLISGGGGTLNIALGGTTVLIVVGVALDTTRQLESQMMMRHYKGFLE